MVVEYIAPVYVDRINKGFVLQNVTVSRKEDHYAETNDCRDDLPIVIPLN